MLNKDLIYLCALRTVTGQNQLCCVKVYVNNIFKTQLTFLFYLYDFVCNVLTEDIFKVSDVS